MAFQKKEKKNIFKISPLGLGYCETPIIFVMNRSFPSCYVAQNPLAIINYEKVKCFFPVSHVCKGPFPYRLYPWWVVFIVGCDYNGLCPL